MNFDFSDQEKASFKKLDDALDACLEDREPDEAMDLDTTKNTLREGLRCLAETDYLDFGLSKEALGDTTTMIAAMEKLAARTPSMFLAVEASTRLFGRAVATWGDEAQKTRWLEPLREGVLVGALGLSESTNNVINEPLETHGERQGEDVLVTGHKGAVINGSIADWIAVAGQLDDGVALFLVPQGAEGLTIGERQRTTAFCGALFNAVDLEACRIPAEQVVGPIPQEALITTLRSWEDQLFTAASLGLMQTALAAARTHAKTHKTGGKPIIAFQEISFKLAEMLTLTQTAQLLAYRAAWAADASPDEAAVLADSAKVFCSESAETVTSEAMQILGTNALLEPNPVARAFACAKLLQVAGTSSEIARVRLGDDAIERWGA